MVNNTAITSRNNADGADITIAKVTASDKLELGATNVTTLSGDSTGIVISNAGTIVGKTAGVAISEAASLSGLSAGMPITNASTLVGIGAGVAISSVASIAGLSSGSTITNMKSIGFSGSFGLDDNVTTPANVTGVLASIDEFAIIHYKITRGTNIQCGTLMIDEDNASLIEESFGDDAGITFTNVSGQLKYISTNTATSGTFKYLMIKG